MAQGAGGGARGARLPLHMLDRPRLTELLDRGHALTVVSGPAPPAVPVGAVARFTG